MMNTVKQRFMDSLVLLLTEENDERQRSGNEALDIIALTAAIDTNIERCTEFMADIGSSDYTLTFIDDEAYLEGKVIVSIGNNVHYVIELSPSVDYPDVYAFTLFKQWWQGYYRFEGNYVEYCDKRRSNDEAYAKRRRAQKAKELRESIEKLQRELCVIEAS